MEMPSFALSPVAPVLFNLSEPARSTKWNLAVRVSNSSISESLARRLSVALSWMKMERKVNKQNCEWCKHSAAFHNNTYIVVRGADSHLAQVDGEDGMGAWTLDVHLGAGGGARQSAQLQTLNHLLEERWKKQMTKNCVLSHIISELHRNLNIETVPNHCDHWRVQLRDFISWKVKRLQELNDDFLTGRCESLLERNPTHWIETLLCKTLEQHSSFSI